MNMGRGIFTILVLAIPVCGLLSGCGLVKAPFRVAGAVVDTAYEGGRKVAKSTSNALEKRKAKKLKEEAEAAKKEAGEKPQQQEEVGGSPGVLPPPDSIPVDQGPIIPLDDQPIPPVEPLPLPQ